MNKNVIGLNSEPAMHYFPLHTAALGHNVVMVAHAGGDSSELRNSNVKIYEIDRNDSWILSLMKINNIERPDIVHIYLYSGCGLLPYLLGFRKHIKFVLDIRSPLLRTGLFRLLHRVKNILEPVGFDAIMTHGIESAWTQIGKREGLHWLPPGVDLSLVPDVTADKRVEVDHARLVYVGSLHPLRKAGDMIRAVSLASRHVSIHLDIYGDGPDFENLNKYVVDNNLTTLVSFKGVIPRLELFHKLVSYDIGLSYIPRGLYDSAPALKTLEYLACGIPVLATETFGNKMFINQGVNGLLVNEDSDSYSAGIVNILKSKHLREMKLNTKPSVNEFDWYKLTMERLLPVYRHILGIEKKVDY